jgi:hypothetical protein
MAQDQATDQRRLHDLRAYAEGYDAFLRLVRQLGDWAVLVKQVRSARQCPYGEEDDVAEAWLDGWRDAVDETYVPPAFAEALARAHNADQIDRADETV